MIDDFVYTIQKIASIATLHSLQEMFMCCGLR
jgi:hypothetical protein